MELLSTLVKKHTLSPKQRWAEQKQMKNLPAMQESHETWVLSLGQEDHLEEGMATHSSILAWRVPWTEKPEGLQSMGSQRVRHNWSDLAWTLGRVPSKLGKNVKIGRIHKILFLTSLSTWWTEHLLKVNYYCLSKYLLVLKHREGK